MTVLDLKPKWAKTEKTKEYIGSVPVLTARVVDMCDHAILRATYFDKDIGENHEIHIRDLASGIILVCLEQEL